MSKSKSRKFSKNLFLEKRQFLIREEVEKILI